MGIRPVMWETTASIVRDAPLIGHGLGSFPEQYRQRGDPALHRMESDAHRRSSQSISADSGGNRLARIGRVCVVSCFRRSDSGCAGSFGVVGIALLLAWCLTSLFSSHFHTFNEGHLIAILLGVCLAREVGDAKSVAQRRVDGRTNFLRNSASRCLNRSALRWCSTAVFFQAR